MKIFLQLKYFLRDLGLNSSVFYSWAGAGPLYRHFSLHTRTGQISLSEDLTSLEEFLQPVTLVVQVGKYFQNANIFISEIFSGDSGRQP